jgi:VanZ family protein
MKPRKTAFASRATMQAGGGREGQAEMKLSVQKSSRIVGWFLALIIAVLSLVPPGLRPETGMPHDLEHFIIFFATGLSFGFGYGRRPFVATVALVVFAGVIELAQLLVSGRHARLSDFIVDALALCIGVAMASTIGARTLGPSI